MEIFRTIKLVNYPPMTSIYFLGDPTDYLYILAKGTVSILNPSLKNGFKVYTSH